MDALTRYTFTVVNVFDREYIYYIAAFIPAQCVPDVRVSAGVTTA